MPTVMRWSRFVRCGRCGRLLIDDGRVQTCLCRREGHTLTRAERASVKQATRRT